MLLYHRGAQFVVVKLTLVCMVLWVGLGCTAQNGQENEIKIFEVRQSDDHEVISVFRESQNEPIVVQNAKRGMRPYLHPIMAPDGHGELTQYSPGHHKHQTGLYWGFTRVNGSGAPVDTLKKWFYNRNKPQRIKDQIGRDFFHFNGDSHWKKVGSEIVAARGPEVSWQTTYHMLDAAGEAMLEETMQWSMKELESKIILDLTWEGKALRDIVINAFSYGGMFLRMPWRKGIAGEAISSSNLKNKAAEGQNAKWVDVGMEIEGREDWGHIAIMDHPQNTDHPTPWRVDGQLGIGPCRAIEGDWQIIKGESEIFRFRIVAYTGKLVEREMEALWQNFKGV